MQASQWVEIHRWEWKGRRQWAGATPCVWELGGKGGGWEVKVGAERGRWGQGRMGSGQDAKVGAGA